jgi:N,N-dimethylformamidase
LLPRRWVELRAGYDAGTGRLVLASRPLPSHSVGDRMVHGPASAAVDAPPGLRTGGRLRFGDGLDGKLEAPALAFRADATSFDASWDFARGIGTDHVVDTGPGGLHGRTVQGPARAVTGARWDGSTQRWTDQPGHYAAIHFHRDDLTDAGWTPDAALTVPDDLPSGFYAFKVTGPDGDVDRTPFFVRPPAGTATAPLAFLVPTATYYAYANHRMTIAGSEFFPARNRLRPEFEYVRAHPEVGYSLYESHDDGSGVMYSSRLRPVLNLKPGADGWAYSADTNLVAFLEHAGLPYDIVTDDDLHHEGRALLDRYQVVMTGSHPEYWSTSMLDALEGWLGDGGRLLYLGGNGFYWRVAWSLEQPHVMEVRRAEDGTRGWIAEPGEYYHEHGGEYGGLWRRLGRAPNRLVGVGFAAQGFDRASYYVRSEASFDSRAAWIFEGVEGSEVIGDYGVGGGAAGQEIDRFDLSLGSPPHGVVLASSLDHSDEMLRTKEEFLATRLPFKDPKVRADIVFFETPGDGAVFSVGSISWYGALAHRGYDNDIARITTNVLRRFLDPAPFPLQPGELGGLSPEGSPAPG